MKAKSFMAPHHAQKYLPARINRRKSGAGLKCSIEEEFGSFEIAV